MREHKAEPAFVSGISTRLTDSVIDPGPSVGRYWRTLRHLRWTQLGYLARRRLLRRSNLGRWNTEPVRIRRLLTYPTFPEWQPPTARRIIEAGEVCFLKQTSRQIQLSWSAKELARVRIYELNYCDFLNIDLTRPNDEALLRAALKIALSWCQQNSSGRELGWEPFPLSLRIVNWVKFLIRNATCAEQLGESVHLAQMLSSLRIQVLSLERRLEKDLLANHLLKNIKALMFAGALLETPESWRWWITGEKLLNREIKEQILSDGGHIERSPMYHVWLLEHLLDLSELISSSPRLASCAVQVANAVTQMTNFLCQILHPDGEIPLFNDSAFGFITRSTAEVLARARLNVANFSGATAGISVLADTGYAVIREPSSESSLIFDCGPLGPDYQPGHGHCDVLSYELSLHKQRVVVDTGVSTYEVGHHYYDCSTGAHNTVRIDGLEQAEIWGAFRVGRRPRVSSIENGEIRGLRFVRGKYFGYKLINVVHSRTIIQVPPTTWVVVDSVSGPGHHRLESFIHFHPAIRVERCENAESMDIGDSTSSQWIVQWADYQYSLRTVGSRQCILAQGWYSPEFGIREAQRVVCCLWEGKLPATMIYWFEPLGAKPLILHESNNQKAFVVNGVTIPLG